MHAMIVPGMVISLTAMVKTDPTDYSKPYPPLKVRLDRNMLYSLCMSYTYFLKVKSHRARQTETGREREKGKEGGRERFCSSAQEHVKI